MEPYLATFLASLCLLGIGHLIRVGNWTRTRMEDISVTLASIRADLSQVVHRVDALDRWKDAVQERETNDLRAENAELKAVQNGRRATDHLG